MQIRQVSHWFSAQRIQKISDPAVGVNGILFTAQDGSERAELANLLEVNGFSVTLADSCDQALDLLRSSAFDLVILDLILMGDKQFGQCKAIHEVVSVPIMLITVSGEDQEIVNGIDAGVSDFITRPIRPVEMIARVRTILKRTSSPLALPGWMIQHDGLLLDLRARKVLHNGKSISLTRTEMRLLSYFMHHVGETVSKTSLLQAVWNYQDETGDYNLVESAIKRLRGLLEEDPKSPKYIFTVWGEGYRFGK